MLPNSLRPNSRAPWAESLKTKLCSPPPGQLFAPSPGHEAAHRGSVDGDGAGVGGRICLLAVAMSVSARKSRLHPVPARRGERHKERAARTPHGAAGSRSLSSWSWWQACLVAWGVWKGITGYHKYEKARQQQQQLCQWQKRRERGGWWGRREHRVELRTATGSPFSILRPLPLSVLLPTPVPKAFHPCRPIGSAVPFGRKPLGPCSAAISNFGYHVGLSQSQVLCCRVWTAPLGGNVG